MLIQKYNKNLMISDPSPSHSTVCLVAALSGFQVSCAMAEESCHREPAAMRAKPQGRPPPGPGEELREPGLCAERGYGHTGRSRGHQENQADQE